MKQDTLVTFCGTSLAKQTCLLGLLKHCRKGPCKVNIIIIYLFIYFSCFLFPIMFILANFECLKLQYERKHKNENVEFNNFEAIRCNLTDNTADTLLNNSCHPDLNFFNTNVQSLITPYSLLSGFHNVFNNFSSNNFSILHTNVRSINKKFQQIFIYAYLL